MYIPVFPCKYCNKEIQAQINGEQGLLVLCDCKEARKAWESEHRAEMERRKKRRRVGKKR
jgi:hypothetical protein